MVSTEERRQKIESFGRATTALREGVMKYPREMWDFLPADGWSIHKTLIHLADGETHSYIRCRRLIAEPGSGVYGYNQDKWTASLHYEQQDPEDYLALFELLRRTSYNLIRDLPDAVWANTVEHSDMGTMSFDQWLDIFERHPYDHLDQMANVFAEWNEWKKSQP